MKYLKIYCAEKRGGISINPIFDLPIIPYNILNAKTELKTNNKFVVSKGKKLYDVLPFEKHFRNIAISESLKKYLESIHATGWSCFPIEIKGINEKYYALQITGNAGEIINLDEVNASSIENPIKNKIIKSSINESDFVLIKGTLIVLIKEEIANKLIKEEFTNLIIEDIHESFVSI